MFPRKCTQPLCRNMLVTSELDEKNAGTTPYVSMRICSCRSLSSSSHTNASVLRVMIPMVT